MAPAAAQNRIGAGSSTPVPMRPPTESMTAVAGMNRPTSARDSPKASKPTIGPAHAPCCAMSAPRRVIRSSTALSRGGPILALRLPLAREGQQQLEDVDEVQVQRERAEHGQLAVRLVAVMLRILRLDVLRVPGGQASEHRSEEHTSELQSRENLVCRLLLEK